MAKPEEFKVGGLYKCDNSLLSAWDNSLYFVTGKEKHKANVFIKIIRGSTGITKIGITSQVAEHSTLIGCSKIGKILYGQI